MKLREAIFAVFGLLCLALLVTRDASAEPETQVERWYFTDVDASLVNANRQVETRLNGENITSASFFVANGKIYVLGRRP
jgi:hypothetical protein